MQRVWVPAIRAQVALNRHDPNAAVELLRASSPNELTYSTAYPVCMYPAYVRGHAYLAARQGAEAAAEFQRIVDHPGVVWNCWTRALAELGLARAHAMTAAGAQGADAGAATARARDAYREFLDLWKDADPGIPILIKARAEFAALR